MSALAPIYEAAESTTAATDYSHVVCKCDENTTLCGLEATDFPWIDDEAEVECVVCADLDEEPCGRCAS